MPGSMTPNAGVSPRLTAKRRWQRRRLAPNDHVRHWPMRVCAATGRGYVFLVGVALGRHERTSVGFGLAKLVTANGVLASRRDWWPARNVAPVRLVASLATRQRLPEGQDPR